MLITVMILFNTDHFCCSGTKSCLTLCDPMDCSPPGSSVHWISRSLEGLYFLLQGILPDQGWNPSLLQWQVDSLPLSYLGNP